MKKRKLQEPVVPVASDSLISDPARTDMQKMHLFTSCTDWPETTQEPCLYCLHAFEGFPFGMPTAFNDGKYKMEAVGFFCSIRCLWAYTKRDNPNLINVTEAWIRNVHGYKRGKLPVPPPFEYYCKLAGELKSERDAIAQWRKSDDGNILRKVPGLFIRAAQVYEEVQGRDAVDMKHSRHLKLMDTTQPKPVVLTSAGQQEQMKFVKRVSEGKQKPGAHHQRGPIDFMLGIK
jgi:hypothetical protein